MTTAHHTSLDADPTAAPRLVGNRIVLAGILLYLCEFVGFALAGVGSLYNEPDTTAQDVLSSYQRKAEGFGFLVGWLGLVLLGRVAIVVGVRAALIRSGRPSPLLDLAVVAMGLSVAFEVASVGMGA